MQQCVRYGLYRANTQFTTAYVPHYFNASTLFHIEPPVALQLVSALFCTL